MSFPKFYKDIAVLKKLRLKNYRLKLALALFAFLLCLLAGLIFLNRFQVSADVNNTSKSTQADLPQISFAEADFFLKIDKILVNAPVIPDVDGADKKVYFSSLQRGVAQMSGTAKPDEKGNVVIFGHSNYYESDLGAYKQVFKNLDELQSGDKIVIRYKNKDYNYAVVKQQKVAPDDIWVISAPYDLTLITCWPPGTIEKRLIVFANKI
ncbi:MAG: Uncharacterized protein CEN92_374 [Candidatus Berkelbacteria bacterium Licking1014_96]|uniref:Sortase n=1 Tax=Candidatus Berkelbacteria bacterium Licking1014_96 TaxID=2017149 RepID=A0A554LD42_9BACT|nr:MAG: Uncharacterized protein CEN92_374 [Candidatus Berkelbacteria bacterium Licking1014_96]